MNYQPELLRQLDNQRYKTIYARITSLTLEELPIEQIEGRITGGSINIDGSSAVRRTCQLSMVVDNPELTDYNWSLYTKFTVSIGVENSADSNIIWFDQGVYVITNFSLANSTNSSTINISGKDKMCLLNGEVGGVLNSSVDFGQIDVEIEKDIYRTIKYPIKDIIREAVHQYANEPFHNIVINDLDDMGLELQEYRYDQPLYIWRESESDSYIQGSINGEMEVDFQGVKKLSELEAAGFIFDSLTSNFSAREPSEAIIDNKKCYIAKITYGQTAGYKETNLVYPSDLIGNIGESITSILDKIKNFLGAFEYFYNLEGQFIFQRKKTFVETVWSAIKEDDQQLYISEESNEAQYSYIFDDLSLFTSYNNTPNINNLRNDFSVWGKRNQSVPIHMRYAIDKKPFLYCSIFVTDEELKHYNEINKVNLKGQGSILYVASEGEYSGQKYKVIDDKTIQFSGIDYELMENSVLNLIGVPKILYNEENQILQLELYQEAVVGDWREIIYQMAKDYRKYNHLDDFEQKIIAANSEYGFYQNGRTGYEQYYIDLEGFWRQIYAPTQEERVPTYEYDEDGWNTAIWDAPNKLNFWFDFLDLTGELDQFSVPKIGHRPKSISDEQVRAIYYKDTPNIIFGPLGDKTGYRYFNAPYADMFSKSVQGKSAKDEIDNLLYNHGYCSESISITSIPIYHLEPNTKIHIKNHGDYIINKISVPLTYNGTMNITAIKAPERLF